MWAKIGETKDLVVSEGDIMNTNIVNFQNKYFTLLKELDEKIDDRHKTFASITRDKFKALEKECERLNQKIDQEKQDRIEQNEENLKKVMKMIDSMHKLSSRLGNIGEGRDAR